MGEPLNVRDLAVPPLVLVGLGIRDVAGAEGLTTPAVTGLVLSGLVAVLLGAARAATVRLLTYAVVSLPASAQSLYLPIGLTLTGESLVLALRGLFSGERFAAEGRDSEATKRVIHSEMASLLRRR